MLLANDTPPVTLFTDDRETRTNTLNLANVLASDTFEAIALATEASPDDDPRPLAALTVEELKAMAEALDRSLLSKNHRVDFLSDHYTTREQITHAIAGWKDRTNQHECAPDLASNPSEHRSETALDAPATEQTALAELEEILRPLVDLLNRKYRGAWDKEFHICHEARFRPLSDADCALIELPDNPEDYPEIANLLRVLVTRSEACLHHYQDSLDPEGPVCGPCRFSVQTKAFSDDGCSYVYGTHLVVERRDLDAQAAEHQIAYLYRELRDQPQTVKRTQSGGNHADVGRF